MTQAVPALGYGTHSPDTSSGTHSPCYGTRSPGKWDAQSLLWDTQSWQMGRTASVKGHTVL
eukprot:1287296-Pyramimonas_sp.AAC.1